MKKNVLIFAKHYAPSIKAGGPVQSIKNLVDNLSDEFNFYIVTLDRDVGDHKPFLDLKIDEWVDIGNANVLYMPFSKFTWRKITQICNCVDYDIMYLNSVFTIKFSIVQILLKKLKRIPDRLIVIAPRGELSEGALKFKSLLKRLYIAVVNIFGFDEGVIWHATADSEKKTIEKLFGEKNNILIASNLTADYSLVEYDKIIEKKTKTLRAVFVSRIHPKKNLKKAIELLGKIKGHVDFNIYGPLEDQKYWDECQVEVSKLGDNINVVYNGVVDHEQIVDIFKKNHVFLFPTLGENYGHVISEALLGGCPVIISDRTPWRYLEQKEVGYDFDLEDEDGFVKALQFFIDLDGEEYEKRSEKAFEYGKMMSNTVSDIEDIKNIFRQD